MITSKLIWDRHQSLKRLIKHSRILLISVPDDEGIAGNETHELEKWGSERLFREPEPASGISVGVAKSAKD
jgi:hypothetical protein